MAFDTTENAGFSTAPASELYIKQDDSKSEINVETEEADPSSLLNELKSLIRMRHEHSAFSGTSEIEIVRLKENSYPLVYRMRSADESMLVILNPSDQELPVDFDLSEKYEIIHEVIHLGETEIAPGMIPAASAIVLKEL